MHIRRIMVFIFVWMGPVMGPVMGAVMGPVMKVAMADASIILQSTTSTKNSGLYDHILPLVKADTGISVYVVAVGTGAAMQNARNCDGDVLLVHSPERERQFVADGYAERRYDVMYNDFVLVGPSSDPARIGGGHAVIEALQHIAMSRSIFVSRGDASGTHGKEQALWREAGIDYLLASGTWYRETGSGMGATINAAIGMGGYTLSDRATWVTFAQKADFKILVEGDKRLFNPYGVMLVSPQKCPFTKAKQGQIFIDWLISAKGQNAIASFTIDGQSLFMPNAIRGVPK